MATPAENAVLAAMATRPDHRWTIADVMRATGLSRSGASRALYRLSDQGSILWGNDLLPMTYRCWPRSTPQPAAADPDPPFTPPVEAVARLRRWLRNEPPFCTWATVRQLVEAVLPPNLDGASLTGPLAGAEVLREPR